MTDRPTLTIRLAEPVRKVSLWIARLNHLSAHPHERAQRRAECVLLGHWPSGERFMTMPPTHICWWCAENFYDA